MADDPNNDSLTGQKRKRPSRASDSRQSKFARTDGVAHPGGAAAMPVVAPLPSARSQATQSAAALEQLFPQAEAEAAARVVFTAGIQMTGRQSCDDENGHFIVQLGENLGPRYKLLSCMGEGTFGKVVEAWDRKRKIRVAIKVIRNLPKYRRAAQIEIGILYDIEQREAQFGDSGCIHLRGYFDHRNHICMVFRKYGQSMYDFLKMNKFRGFRYQHVIDFAYQLTYAVAYLHQLEIVHTDLKPENVLFITSETLATFDATGRQRSYRLPASTAIKLIDFGSAIYNSDFHAAIVSTRHYRAPEIVMGIPWSYPCDVWSLGCIFIELLSGEAVFQTHDNAEHLAMMEALLGPVPQSLVSRADASGRDMFDRGGVLRWPELCVSKNGTKHVGAVVGLERMFDEEKAQLIDLVSRMLRFEPATRIKAKEALAHPVFEQVRERVRAHIATSEANATGTPGGAVAAPASASVGPAAPASAKLR